MTKDIRIEVRDLRNGDWYWVHKIVLADGRLNQSDKIVYHALAFYANNKSQDCFPSIPTICELINASYPTVQKAIKNLERFNYVMIDQKAGKVNTYSLLKVVTTSPVDRNYKPLKNFKGLKNFSPQDEVVHPLKIGSPPPKNRQSNKNKPNKKKLIIKYIPKDMELAQLLYYLIKEENPHWYVKPQWDTWAEDIRKIRELDKDPETGKHRTLEQIKFTIQWAQNDDFWKKNILSPFKLRKQFNTLVVQIKAAIPTAVIIPR